MVKELSFLPNLYSAMPESFGSVPRNISCSNHALFVTKSNEILSGTLYKIKDKTNIYPLSEKD